MHPRGPGCNRNVQTVVDDDATGGIRSGLDDVARDTNELRVGQSALAKLDEVHTGPGNVRGPLRQQRACTLVDRIEQGTVGYGNDQLAPTFGSRGAAARRVLKAAASSMMPATAVTTPMPDTAPRA